MRQPIRQLSRDIGYEFNDHDLADQALTHRSAGGANNERQEFLGDAILGFIIAETLYEQFPEADEGQLSRLRSRLVKRDTLAGIARELELGKYLSLGPGELRSGGHSRDSTLADALEALLAAVYQDGGYAAARRTVLALFQSHIASLSPDAEHKDPKTRLQEFLQSRKLALPVYQLVDVSGEQHDQRFTMNCCIEGIAESTTGTGNSRRKAEQEAARKFLRLLKESRNG